MKIQLFTVALVLVGVTVHCKPANNRYKTGQLRSNRSPVQDTQDGYFYEKPNQVFLEEPQFNNQPGSGDELGIIPSEEAPIDDDVNLPEVPIEENIPNVTEQSVQDTVTELPNPPKEEEQQPKSEESDVREAKPKKKNRPSINFFPVTFGSGRGRSGFPGGTVAIANSFSTGRRGVATSNAKAFSDPSGFFKNTN